jgi:hypothetical protein
MFRICNWDQPGGVDGGNEACEAAVGVLYTVSESWLVDEHDIRVVGT